MFIDSSLSSKSRPEWVGENLRAANPRGKALRIPLRWPQLREQRV